MSTHFHLTTQTTLPLEVMFARSLSIDEQVKGPFKDFRHEHVFSTADGVTTMSDHVTFTAPLGPLGRIAEQLVLGRYLKRLIAERNTFLSRPL